MYIISYDIFLSQPIRPFDLSKTRPLPCLVPRRSLFYARVTIFSQVVRLTPHDVALSGCTFCDIGSLKLLHACESTSHTLSKLIWVRGSLLLHIILLLESVRRYLNLQAV
jgi:hypothetical protein